MKSSIFILPASTSDYRTAGRGLFTRRRAQQMLLCLMISAALLWLGASRARMAALQSNIPVGNGAFATAVNVLTNRIYVANRDDNNVTVINGADHSTAIVAVGTRPVALAINPVTNKIYVANSGSNSVTVINGMDNSIATVSAGIGPQALAANSVSNKIYAANLTSNTVTVIDGADNSTVTVPVGTRPLALAINPVTNKVYVANQSSNDVTVIDGVDNSTTAVLSGIGPSTLAVNPATNKIYVGAIGGAMTIINGADNSKTTLVLVPSGIAWAIAVNPVTNRIYALSAGSVRVINGVDNTQAQIFVGQTPSGLAINPTTNKIYATNISDGKLTVINGADNSTSSFTTGTDPEAVAVNPVTNKIYVTDTFGRQVSVIDGSDYPRMTVATGAKPIDVALNPVTNKIYVANQQSNNVTVINGADNSTATVPAGSFPQAVAVNSVSNKIYIANCGATCGGAGGGDVTVVNGADNSPVTVAAGNGPFAVAVNPLTNKIYVANKAGSSVTVINGADNSTATVTVGTAPVAIAVNPVTNKIYVANSGSGNLTVLDGTDNSTLTIATGSVPQAVAVNSATDKIYVANCGSICTGVGNGDVTVMNGADNSKTTITTVLRPQVVAVNPVTNRIYVAGETGGTTVINGVDNSTTSVPGNEGAIAVNPATNKIYVASTSFKPRVINGADNSLHTLDTIQSTPIAIAVNPVTNTVYVANNGSNNINVYPEQDVQPVPLTVNITSQAFQPNATSRTFNFNASSTFSPTAPPVQQIHYQVDTWINPWSTATPSGNNTQSATIGPLSDGSHILYAYATDGGDGATSSPAFFGSNGSGPVIGQMQALVFFINSQAPPPPTISVAGPLSPQQGSAARNFTIANVNDPASGPGSVSVVLTSANPSNGVTISNIVNNAGTITADVIADCAASDASFSLRATDANGWIDATLDVTVIANTSPTLIYNNASLVSGGSIMINSATGPSDNGAVESIVLQSPGTYTGNVSVNSTTGVVSISNAAPVGTHNITIRATDNCAATTDSQLTLTVTDLPNNCTAVVAHGNWSNPATWGCGHLPTANDAVVIQSGRNITLDVDPSAFSISVNFGSTLTISGDHTLATNLNVNGTLSFGSSGSEAGYSSPPSASVVSSNKLITGSNLVSFSCTGIVSDASSSGYVIGNVNKVYCAAATFSYPTGTANEYSPVDVNVTSLATNPASLAVTAIEGVQPALASQASTSLHRHWTLTGAGLTTDLTFNYLVGDVMGIEAAYKVIRVSGGTAVAFPASTVNTTNHQGTLTGVNSFSDWTLGQVTAPTASESTISGQIIESNGNPVEGAGVQLTGMQNRLTVTDAQGNYRFDNVETNGFYTIAPSRANFVFSPAQRSFSQLGQNTDAIFNATSTGATSNPLDTTEYFVRQQYIDFLGREPDEPGFNFWVNNIETCGEDANCRAIKRTDTSAAFFLSIEFQQTGYLAYRTYQAAYGDLSGAPVPINFNEFNPDTQAIRRNVVVNQNGWQDRLEDNKRAFVEEFVQRARFTNLYASMNDGQFVDTLNQNAGSVLSQIERDQLVSDISTNTKTRAQALRTVAENEQLAELEFNHAFVLMQYFGYLCRDANTGPDTDFSGYNFWLSKLNTFGGDFREAEMVKAFLLSREYRRRFPR
ncbi:MAG TPA: hypothetical protein VGO56_15105 [Pyrinomonadaceae bacterium]|jgi:YVTN family beta-propeller protein|nr:hypothetical protein [Pyrinomonadaceae bacterium]